MPYAIEIKNSWLGIVLPPGIRAFDCRRDGGKEFHRTQWGTSICGSEAAAHDLSLRDERFKEQDATLLSCQTYTDARTCNELELKRQITDMLQEVAYLEQTYERAKKNPAEPGNGGGCVYKPLAICMSNFGWSILADKRTCIVEAF